MPEENEVLMTNITDVTIIKAILHIADNSSLGDLVLSELPLDISPEKVNNFLKKHIIDSLRDDKIHKAKFNMNPTNIISDLCQQIITCDITNDTEFIESSSNIAKNLYKYMQKGNISSGYLIICLYKDNNDNLSIAILKMDYNDYFVSNTKTISGKRVNELIPKTNGLPSLKQKLQKCAFIKYFAKGNTYDLIVLDKQPNKLEEEVALFFYKYFLDCTFCKDVKSNTRAFFQKTCAFIKNSYNEEPMLAKEKISILYNIMRNNETFNAHTFAESVFGNDETMKDKYLQDVIINNDLEYESEIDKSYVDKKLNRVNIVSQEGIEIALDTDVMEDDNVFSMEESEDIPGTYNILIKNIHIDGKNIKTRT